MCRAVREGGSHEGAASVVGCIGHGFLELMETDLYLKVGGDIVFSADSLGVRCLFRSHCNTRRVSGLLHHRPR